jgi:hypothetical protein
MNESLVLAHIVDVVKASLAECNNDKERKAIHELLCGIVERLASQRVERLFDDNNESLEHWQKREKEARHQFLKERDTLIEIRRLNRLSSD